MVAGNADRSNGRGAAFVNIDRDAHAVAFKRRHRRFDRSPVIASGEVLTAQFLIGAGERCIVENAAFGKPHVTKTLFDRILVKRLNAVRFNGCYGRTLHHVNNHNVAVLSERHIAEKSGLIKGTDGADTLFGRVFITSAERKMRKDRTGLRTRETLDADVGNRERRSRAGKYECGGKRGRQAGNSGELQDDFSLNTEFCIRPLGSTAPRAHQRQKRQPAAPEKNCCKVSTRNGPFEPPRRAENLRNASPLVRPFHPPSRPISFIVT